MRLIKRRCESLEPRLTLDSTVVFNEIMYHPANDGTPEWIELHNQMAVDMDLSAWKLRGGVDFDMPAGTVVPRQGYLVISADPAALASKGYSGALGPWVRSLDNSGERIDLINNSNRLMNRVDYDDDGAWPVGPDGTGATLAKRNEDAASDLAASWATSAQVGGTPGRENFPPYAPPVRDTTAIAIDGVWRYNDVGADLGTTWRNTNYDASSWVTGPALLYDETGTLPAPKNTPLAPGRTTYYFRMQFDFAGDPTKTELRLRPVVDDGAIYYLNGVEVYRQNMPAGTVTYDTLASGQVGNATFTGPITIPAANLVVGANVLAVEVHQGPLSAQNGAAQLRGIQHQGQRLSRSVRKHDAGAGLDLRRIGDMDAAWGWFPTCVVGEHRSEQVALQRRIVQRHRTERPGDGSRHGVWCQRRRGARAGVAASSIPAAAHPGEGINYIFYGNGNGIQQSEFLNDYIAHGPQVVTPSRALLTNYWVRLLHEPNKAAGGGDPLFNGVNDSFAKIWPADGTTPEPSMYQYSWASNDSRSGLAGLTIGFDNVTRMEVGYILIQASGLPSMQVTWPSGGGGPALDDVVFGAELVTRQTLPDPTDIHVAINEIAAGGTAPFFVELVNTGSQTSSLDGFVLAKLGVTNASHTISGITLTAGQKLAFTEGTIGFRPVDGDRLVLYSPNRTSVIDAVVVGGRLRANAGRNGRMAISYAATPSAANLFDFADEIVINEIMYHSAAEASDARHSADASHDNARRARCHDQVALSS